MIDVSEEYPYASIDTEFPGIVLEPFVSEDSSISSWNYAQLRDNVNALKLIQLGITLADDEGKVGGCWQYNFKFDVEEDMHAADAIELLTNAGLNFENNSKKGIEPEVFGERFMSSGIVLNENVRWVSFHGLYDFGYLLKVLTSSPLPDAPEGFFESLDLFFPKRCDIKYLLKDELRGGLSALGIQFGCQRRGQSHQGGSDALLTNDVFFAIKLKDRAFDEESQDSGGLFGLTNDERHSYHPFYQANTRQTSPNREAVRDHHMVTPPLSMSPPMQEQMVPRGPYSQPNYGEIYMEQPYMESQYPRPSQDQHMQMMAHPQPSWTYQSEPTPSKMNHYDFGVLVTS